MIKALVFDMDGVIIDSEPIHAGIALNVLKDFNKEASLSELLKFSGIRNDEMWSVMRRRYGIDETVENLVERQSQYTQQYFRHEKLKPVEGIPGLMKSARKHGLKIALATSSPREFAEHVLAKVGLIEYFDALVTGDDISHSKPDPEIYLKAAELLGIAADECIAIEDAPAGIESAKRAGMKCVAFIGSGQQDTTWADFVVSSIWDIDLDKICTL